MMMDGLEDAYQPGKPMGAFAEDAARQYQFTREEQDAFALESLARAQMAIATDAFAGEVAAVSVSTRRGVVEVAEDEQPGNAKPGKVPELRPAFASDGTITAATSASISDGAAALVLVRESVADERGITKLARIVATRELVQVRLTDGTTGEMLWGERIDAADREIFELQEHVAARIVAQPRAATGAA